MLLNEQQCHGVASEPPGDDEPWFTGPLLTPSARVIPPGHVNLEPYLFWNVTTGRYGDNWHATKVPTFNRVTMQFQVKFGIFERVDFTIVPQSSIAFTQGESHSTLDDLPIGISYLLYKGGSESWIDYVKLSFLEIFPIGKYQHLDPELFGADAGGQGSYVSNFGLTASKLYKVGSNRFLGCRCNLTATIPSTASIKGISIFGGDPSTKGRIHHGTTVFFTAGAEYTVTQRFSLACDFLAQYTPKRRFSGFTIIPIIPRETIQFSFAPAVEYNWSPTMGVIVGAWFTVAGKNSNRFINGVAAFNYYF